MAIHKVHNLHEQSDGNWLKYWEDAIGRKAMNCYRVYCENDNKPAKATDGAHVQLDDPNDKHWYIVPLCHKCNCQFGKHFWVRGPLVRVTDSTIVVPIF